MASVTSNLPEYGHGLYRLADAFNLLGTGGGRKLGDELADATAVAISGRTRSSQTQPDGTPLPKLNARYKKRKVAQGYDPRILVRTGEMTEPLQIQGEVIVTSNTATMTSGLDEDIQNLICYAEDGSDNRPKRHFIDPGPEGEAAFGLVLDEAADRAVR